MKLAIYHIIKTLLCFLVTSPLIGKFFAHETLKSSRISYEFLIEPHNVTVLSGRTVIIPCKIKPIRLNDNLNDKEIKYVYERSDQSFLDDSSYFTSTSENADFPQVQWVKDGFALGTYLDLLEFTDIMSIQSNMLKGEFHLTIRNISEEEAGFYQCQINPAPNFPGKISQGASLSVFVPPKPPIFLGDSDFGNHTNAIILQENVITNITCLAQSGYPNALSLDIAIIPGSTQFGTFINFKILQQSEWIIPIFGSRVVWMYKSITVNASIYLNKAKIFCQLNPNPLFVNHILINKKLNNVAEFGDSDEMRSIAQIRNYLTNKKHFEIYFKPIVTILPTILNNSNIPHNASTRPSDKRRPKLLVQIGQKFRSICFVEANPVIIDDSYNQSAISWWINGKPFTTSHIPRINNDNKSGIVETPYTTTKFLDLVISEEFIGNIIGNITNNITTIDVTCKASNQMGQSQAVIYVELLFQNKKVKGWIPSNMDLSASKRNLTSLTNTTIKNKNHTDTEYFKISGIRQKFALFGHEITVENFSMSPWVFVGCILLIIIVLLSLISAIPCICYYLICCFMKSSHNRPFQKKIKDKIYQVKYPELTNSINNADVTDARPPQSHKGRNGVEPNEPNNAFQNTRDYPTSMQANIKQPISIKILYRKPESNDTSSSDRSSASASTLAGSLILEQNNHLNREDGDEKSQNKIQLIQPDNWQENPAFADPMISCVPTTKMDNCGRVETKSPILKTSILTYMNSTLNSYVTSNKNLKGNVANGYCTNNENGDVNRKQENDSYSCFSSNTFGNCNTLPHVIKNTPDNNGLLFDKFQRENLATLPLLRLDKTTAIDENSNKIIQPTIYYTLIPIKSKLVDFTFPPNNNVQNWSQTIKIPSQEFSNSIYDCNFVNKAKIQNYSYTANMNNSIDTQIDIGKSLNGSHDLTTFIYKPTNEKVEKQISQRENLDHIASVQPQNELSNVNPYAPITKNLTLNKCNGKENYLIDSHNQYLHFRKISSCSSNLPPLPLPIISTMENLESLCPFSHDNSIKNGINYDPNQKCDTYYDKLV